MALSVKETSKTDIKIKGCTVSDGKFYDEGTEKNLIDLLVKTFGEDTIFDLAATTKIDEEIDINAVNEDE
ncbi:hypothetical protein K413DRAFT_4726 [Clostridium sp. ASBs410]|nr:hypothetical protein K413DRAFT_4726 [Clostridium sp. ASBs410]